MRTDGDLPSPPPRTPRRRLVTAAALLLVAVGAAVAAAALLTRYMDARAASARVATARVVVARADIPVATSIQRDWLAVVDWPTASGLEGTEADPVRLVDRVAIVPIGRGEPVLAAKLAGPGARGGLATLVLDGMRAVAVRVDDVVGVAGFVHPGDRVDVIVTMAPGNQEPPSSRVILQNVKVLAVGKDVQHKGKETERSLAATVATLMVTPHDSERLALASSKGKLLLTLRGDGDQTVEVTPGARPAELLAHSGDARRAPGRAARAASAGRAPHAPGKDTVEIIRGNLFEKRNFARAGDP